MDKYEPDSGLSFERVVFFSDAVFANRVETTEANEEAAA